MRPAISDHAKREPHEGKRRSKGRILLPVGLLRTSEMIQKDLVEADIEPALLGQRVDFHALRMTMVTHLSRSGIPLVTAQRMARHSTPVLTSNANASVGLSDLDSAIEAVPSVAQINDDSKE